MSATAVLKSLRLTNAGLFLYLEQAADLLQCSDRDIADIADFVSIVFEGRPPGALEAALRQCFPADWFLDRPTIQIVIFGKANKIEECCRDACTKQGLNRCA